MTIQNWSVIYPRFGDVIVIQFVNIVTITAALTWNSHIFPGVKLHCKTSTVGVGQKISAIVTDNTQGVS